MDSMVTGMSPLAMMSMHEQYPWMKEKKSSRKQMQGRAQPRLGSCIQKSSQRTFVKISQSQRRLQFYFHISDTITIQTQYLYDMRVDPQ